MKTKIIHDRYGRGAAAPVHLEAYFGAGQRIYIHTGVNVEKKYWNTKDNCVTNKHPDQQIMNAKISQLARRVHDYAVQSALMGKPATVQGLRAYIPETRKTVDVLQFARQVVGEDEKNITDSTLKQRFSFLKNLEAFCPGNFDGVGPDWLQRYHDHLLKTMKPESTSKNHKPMKRILEKARLKGMIEVNPYNSFRIPEARNRTVFLTTDELAAIRKYQGIERLERVRDIFLFQCLTGVSFVDMQELTPANLHTNQQSSYLVSARHKTGQQFLIPLLPEALALINRYRSTTHLMPAITNQRMNGYLKEIATICNINKPLTTHVARHTFATLMLARGMPLESISHILGHSSTRITQIYGKIVIEKLMEDIRRLNISGL